MAKYRIPLQILLLLFLSGCDLFKSADKTEQLPPATQEGKNTFGCLVNGKVWLPKGNNGTANLDASYDPSYNGGTLSVAAYRIESSNFQGILIGASNITLPSSMDFHADGTPLAQFFDEQTSCGYNDSLTFLGGALQITKLSIGSQIASGTSHFKVVNQGCDTVKVTDGRFDLKF